jgi:hypothetical protein
VEDDARRLQEAGVDPHQRLGPERADGPRREELGCEDLDVLVHRAGAAGAAEVVAGDARAVVVDRAQAVAALGAGVVGDPFAEEQLPAVDVAPVVRPDSRPRAWGRRAEPGHDPERQQPARDSADARPSPRHGDPPSS